MTSPITVYPRNDKVEASKFDGTHESATAIAGWLQQGVRGPRPLAMNYAFIPGEGSSFNFYLDEDTYELREGDWVIKDGDLFSVVRRQDFRLRYVTGIEKIKLEAGMD